MRLTSEMSSWWETQSKAVTWGIRTALKVRRLRPTSASLKWSAAAMNKSKNRKRELWLKHHGRWSLRRTFSS